MTEPTLSIPPEQAAEALAALTPARLRELYVGALRMRLVLDEKIGMKLRGQHDIGGFFIGGMGEEVHGAATAEAIWRALELPEGQPAADRLAIFAHYRSDTLLDVALQRQGYGDFVLDQFRQQGARATDPSAAGRQMVMHVCMPGYGIAPNQSALGMQLGKAAGYAKGWHLQGIDRGVLSVGVIGDGTTATSDFHEAVSAAALWSLPVLFLVTDNRVAISTPAEEAVTIVDFAAYGRAFGVPYLEADAGDFDSLFSATYRAARHVSEQGGPVILRVPVTRFRGHSSSGLKEFDPDAFDPLVHFGQALAGRGVLAPEEVLRPKQPWPNQRTRYLANYEPNPLAEALTAEIRALRDQALAEPSPDPAQIWEHARPAFPDATEPPSDWDGPRTEITVAQAIRTALDRALTEGPGAVWGEDVGHTLGGVFGCTRSLAERHPGRVLNTPINEPLIMGLAAGAALHPGLALFPEIQFADYSLNTLHWMVHLGHLHWATYGQVSPNVTVRMPSDPTLTGALYHSQSVETYFGHAPGMVVCMPSNAFDAYGLLRTASRYPGPVAFLEPKDLYRVRFDPRGGDRLLQAGPRLPGEVPGAEDGPAQLDDFFVPLGVLRRVRPGRDVTLVAYGLAVHKAVVAARQLAEEGLDAEILDLRTLAPYDRQGVLDAVRRTGALVVCTEDRVYASFANQVLRDVHEALPEATARVVGMHDVPATGMAPALYHATVLQPERIAEAARDVLATPRQSGAAPHLDNELAWLQHAPTWQRR